MLNIALLLAQADVERTALGDTMAADTREKLILFAALLLVSLLVIIWAVAFRKRQRTHRSRHHHPRELAPKVPLEPATNSFFARRRQRRRRREHRPRNPTLAETGGLPPLRQDNTSQLPPSSS